MFYSVIPGRIIGFLTELIGMEFYLKGKWTPKSIGLIFGWLLVVENVNNLFQTTIYEGKLRELVVSNQSLVKWIKGDFSCLSQRPIAVKVLWGLL